MKCYYEVLEISREADDSEIKIAYRKLALKWHPDKNINNPDEAKEQFQLVQQAYETLSDRHERAWYDNHREQILRGSNKEYKDDSLDVYTYFTTQCFKGYGDDENGFYTTYRKVFEQLSQEDIEHMDSKSDYDEIPSFGCSASDYDDVVEPFYNYWSSYTTKKSYVWLDPYNIKEARNNRELKLVEKENRKVRLKAKKERNEEVRNLVAFVRKRDKRVQANVKRLEAKVAENRSKQEQMRKQKILENKKAVEETNQAQWSRFDNVQKELEEIEKKLAAEFGENLSDSDEETSENEENDLYCVVCNKVFKSPKAFENHELSKKHRENVEILKQTMLQEEEENIDQEEEISDDDDVTVNELFCVACNKEYKTRKAFINHETSQKHLLNLEPAHENPDSSINVSKSGSLEDINEISEESNTTNKKKNKKLKKVVKLQVAEDISDPEKHPKLQVTSDEEFDFSSSKKSKKKTKQKSDSKKIQTSQVDTPKENGVTENHHKKSTKKTQRKNLANIVNLADLDDIDLSHCCVVCKSSFDSKNKLFEHLKKTGHSAVLPQKVPNGRKRVK